MTWSVATRNRAAQQTAAQHRWRGHAAESGVRDGDLRGSGVGPGSPLTDLNTRKINRLDRSNTGSFPGQSPKSMGSICLLAPTASGMNVRQTIWLWPSAARPGWTAFLSYAFRAGAAHEIGRKYSHEQIAATRDWPATFDIPGLASESVGRKTYEGWLARSGGSWRVRTMGSCRGWQNWRQTMRPT